MNLIPEVKDLKKGNRRKVNGCKFTFNGDIDERVIKLCGKVPYGDTQVTITVDGKGGDGYKIKFSDKKAEICADGQSGAFYAVQTLRQIIKNGYCDAAEINDAPDFPSRGFYFDITRGRVPKIETLKKLVDLLSYCKINMLQLYVEHVFPFKEYDGIYQRTGYITPEEIKELDKYCHENFVELVPSLSCFGHLYELLNSEKYNYLCEIENYKPETVDWNERMLHHTIDTSNPQSIEVIKSLINQYSPLFTSDKFNICCDETFDLCSGRNIGRDKGKAYVDFVNKVASYVKSLGKTPMVWGDVICNHPEFINEIDNDVIFLSWRYDKNPSPDMIKAFYNSGKKQYVCPGVNNWNNLMEMTDEGIGNISAMAEYGKEYGAVGLLNTCWGDHGHISPLVACMYGILFGAHKAWNVGGASKIDSAMDTLYYGYKGAAKLVRKLSAAEYARYWYNAVAIYSNEKYSNEKMQVLCDPDKCNKAFEICEDVIPYLMAEKWENDEVRETLLNVAEGIEILLAIIMSYKTGEKLGIDKHDAEEWIKKYSRIFLNESKESELKIIVSVIYSLAEKYLNY